MFRKPHAFVILLIGLLLGAFAYAYFTSSQTSSKAEFLLKKDKTSAPLTFVSVSEHKDKAGDTPVHRSDSKESKSKTSRTKANEGPRAKNGAETATPEIQESHDKDENNEDHNKASDQENQLPPNDLSAESANQPDTKEQDQDPSDSDSETDVEKSNALAASDEAPKKSTPYLEGITKTKPETDSPSTDQNSSSSEEKTAEPSLEQASSEGETTSKNPVLTYSNPKNEPEIILVVEGLGRRQETLELALDLPEGVTLAFHSFEGVEEISSKIRSDGHETLLMLPMEPLDYPQDDPGPTALLTGLDPSENVGRLKVHLANLPSCIGVTPFLGSRFLVSKKDLQPVFKALKEQNLSFIETFQTSKSVAHKAARKESLSFQRIENRLDETLTQEAVLKELAVLEEEAQKEGQAFAVTQDVPMVLRLIAEWSKTLPEKKIRLAPLSSCFAKKNETI